METSDRRNAPADTSMEPALDGSPNPPTLGDILRLQARANPDREAMSFEGRRTTYSQMLDQVLRASNALRARGLGPGDRIGILAKNSDSFFEVLLAASVVGSVLVPINWRLSSGEIGYILSDAKVRVLLVGEEFQGLARDAVAAAGTDPLVAMLKGEDSLSAWSASAPATEPDAPVSPHDVVLQLYTSGTTGRPKGVLLTHHSLNCVRVSQPVEAGWCRWDETDTCLVAMPLFHIGGIGTALASIYNGARMVIAREFVPTQLLDFIERDGITRLFIVPAALRILLDDPQFAQTDLSRLRYVIYGSSPITPQLLEEAMRRFGCPFVQVYGMTETSGTITAMASHEAGAATPERLRSAGRPLQGVEIAILDGSGAHLPAGEVGEVAIRSGANMVGYWNLPEASAAAVTADGYLRSGDAGYLDAEGYLFIHDRVKDMIITGGENVYAVEVETALCEHPAIREAAVIGIPDDKWGEAVKALVVLADGRQLDAEALRAWARNRLAAYKIPKTVDFVAALPKNASGKVLRRELREPYWKGRGRAI